ncbi:MAG: L,D-transpeptidase [Polyangiaceae bacterium]
MTRTRSFHVGFAVAVTTHVATATPKTNGADPHRGLPSSEIAAATRNSTAFASTLQHPYAEAEALRVIAEEVPLFQGPSRDAPRRGTLRRDAEVWAYGHARGTDCAGDWLLVGPSAWACDEPGRFDGREGSRGSPENRPLTHRFAKIARNGGGAYRSWDKVLQGLPEVDLEPGFFVGIVEERTTAVERFLRTTHDLWVATSDVTTVTPSDSAGTTLDPEAPSDETLAPYLPVGWVYVDHARACVAIDGPERGAVLPRLSPLRIEATTTKRDKRWFRTPLGWFSERQVRVPAREAPPEELTPGARWLDVAIDTQTLVAYRGRDAVFATLVSTGREGAREDTETPRGTHRIWVKLLWSDMDNLEMWTNPSPEIEDVRPYDVEAVPWVMYFRGGYGLHATYWHDRFGIPQSHGCVNLSLRDAERIFDFASPSLGPGWQAAHPSDYDPATIVRVH